MYPSYPLPVRTIWPEQDVEWKTISFPCPCLGGRGRHLLFLSAQSLFSVSSVNNTPISLMEGFFPTLNDCDGAANPNTSPHPHHHWPQG